MLPLERQKEILKYMRKKISATVSELSAHFNVHEATIRRDLSALEKEGSVRRTHGGVVLSDEVLSEPVFHERESKQLDEKMRIGELVASLIDDNDTIILDSGTTTLRIAELLNDKIGLTIITNDINIATTLRFSKSVKVIVTGGVLFPDSFMLNGMITNDIIKSLNVNKAFIGTPALHHQKGLTHFDEYLVQAKKEMIKSAKQVFVVTDHTKFGRVSLHNVANISEIHGLITGHEADDEILENWSNFDLEVFLA